VHGKILFVVARRQIQLSLISDFFYVVEQQLISVPVITAAFRGRVTKKYGPISHIR